MKITVIVEKELCIGSMTCVVEDEEHFALDDSDRAVVREKRTTEWKHEVDIEVTEAQKEQFLKIAKLCPTRAIRILDENKKQLFPN